MSVTLTWTRGNGNQVLIIVRQDSSTVTDPTDGATYSANSVFASGDDLGSNSYAVYNSTGTSFTLTGLSYASTYYVEFFEQNTSGDCYNLTPLTYNFTTDSCYIFVDDASNTNDRWTASSAAGSDISGDGSASTPYASLSKVFSSHQLTAGSVIKLDRGTYNSSAEDDINPDNNDDDFIIQGADTSTIINPDGATSRAFYFSKNGSVTLKGFKITGISHGSDGAGIYYENNDDNSAATLTLEGMVFDGVKATGMGYDGGVLWLGDVGTNTTSNLVISNCVFYGCQASGRGAVCI